jgi:hypothetical protein
MPNGPLKGDGYSDKSMGTVPSHFHWLIQPRDNAHAGRAWTSRGMHEKIDGSI